MQKDARLMQILKSSLYSQRVQVSAHFLFEQSFESVCTLKFTFTI